MGAVRRGLFANVLTGTLSILIVIVATIIVIIMVIIKMIPIGTFWDENVDNDDGNDDNNDDDDLILIRWNVNSCCGFVEQSKTWDFVRSQRERVLNLQRI